MEGRKKLGEQSRPRNWHYGKLTALLTAWTKLVEDVLYSLNNDGTEQTDELVLHSAH